MQETSQQIVHASGIHATTDAQTFPVKCTKHLRQLVMQNPLAYVPIKRQFAFSEEEWQIQPGFTTDPFSEKQYNPLPGVFHKYRQRVLLTVSATCAVHCRFCFRRWMPIQTPVWPATISYLQAHPKVQEVILSGGDPLMLKPDVLQRIMAYLVKVPQLQTIRVHSRVPIAKPLQSYQFPWTAYSTLNKILVIHCNHPSEISTQTAKVCQDLAQQGVRLYSQTVLLKGINDRIKILSQLYHALWQIGVQPYYLHLLDRVQGAAHFEVSALRAKRLYTVMQHYLPGYLIPKLVREEHRGKRYLSNY